MIEKPTQGLFVVGTDTGVGKTHVGCALARRLVRSGFDTGVYKPVESGWGGDSSETTDAFRLWNAAGQPLNLDAVCPQRFLAPLAADQAAALEGRELDLGLLRTGLARWKDSVEFMLVECAGGLMSPLCSETTNLDLAADIDYPLLLVANNSLGVINRTLQAVQTIQSYRPGVRLAAIVLCEVDEDVDESRATNADAIQQRVDVPVLDSMAFNQSELAIADETFRGWLASLAKPTSTG